MAVGRTKCYICGRKITFDNISGILMIEEGPALICDTPSCIARVALSREKQETTIANK